MIQSGMLKNKHIKLKKGVDRANFLTSEQNSENNIYRYLNTVFNNLYSSFGYLDIFGPSNHFFGLYMFTFEHSALNHV